VALAVLTCLAGAVAAGAQRVADSGWRSHSLPAAGFELDTPAAWLDVTSATSKILDRAAKSPELASLVQIARSNNLIKFLCADPTGFPNVNVIEAVSGPIGLRALVAANVAEIKRVSAVSGPVSVTPLRLPAGPAELVSYQETTRGHHLQALQYFLVHRGRVYILTYTTPPSPDAKTRAVVTRSARSFHFTGSALVS
jgi:hypothetical protein